MYKYRTSTKNFFKALSSRGRPGS